ALTITTTDTAGNAAFVEQTITVDTGIVTPTADINAGSDSAINNDDITSDNTPTIDGTGEIGASVVITNAANVVVGTGTVDADGNYSITTSTLVDGTQALTITTTDTAGNAAFVEQTITVDTGIVTPTADINAGSDSAINNDDITSDNTPTIDGTGEIGASVVITNAANVVVGTGTVDADGNYSITTSTLVDGTQALTITTTDTAGNAAFVEQTITVDTAVVTPSVTIADIDANDDGVYNAAELGTDGTVTATIAVTGSKAGDTLTYNVDGATPVTVVLTADDIANGIAIEVLPEAKVTATLSDDAGNTSAPVSATAFAADVDIATPSVTIADIDANDDGVYNAAELGTDGTVTATIAVTGSKAGDTLTYNVDGATPVTVVLTADDIANGIAIEVLPEAKVTATLSDDAGNTSAPVSATAFAADVDIATPSVTIADIDANDDGVYNAAELGTDGTVTATIAVTGSKAGDTLTYNVDGATPVTVVLTADDIANGIAIEVLPEAKVTATLSDDAGNTSAPVSATAFAAGCGYCDAKRYDRRYRCQ
ncbi:hypothetical protein PE36_02994, partial [Moritella sp. PE36]|uniref:Ig-like domain-containing protein n=1 Tax=Moritella sp. PE36 TaxID=58051 RepID=UPI0001569063